MGAKFWLILGYALPIPFWDESEVRVFFKPWVESQMTWQVWIAPHHGQRLFFTRLVDVAGCMVAA